MYHILAFVYETSPVSDITSWCLIETALVMCITADLNASQGSLGYPIS